MFDSLKTRIYNKSQFIQNIKSASVSENYRGLPILNENLCSQCHDCANICPTKAISFDHLSIDLGKCIFCGDCQYVCTTQAIKFTNFHKLATTNREKLIIKPNKNAQDYTSSAIEVSDKIKQIFGKSLKLRQVSAGGCNGCELELNACSNVNFDMGRYGIDFVASPRHADGLVITGPITQNMSYALEDAYEAMADPKIIILVGTCAISGGIFQESNSLNRNFLDKYKIDLFIPGCPVHPLTFINGILDYLGN